MFQRMLVEVLNSVTNILVALISNYILLLTILVQNIICYGMLQVRVSGWIINIGISLWLGINGHWNIMYHLVLSIAWNSKRYYSPLVLIGRPEVRSTFRNINYIIIILRNTCYSISKTSDSWKFISVGMSVVLSNHVNLYCCPNNKQNRLRNAFNISSKIRNYMLCLDL